jgi:plasmid maintenance system antidote protein VapI
MYFRNDAAFWMHLQVAWDMRSAARRVRGSAR